MAAAFLPLAFPRNSGALAPGARWLLALAVAAGITVGFAPPVSALRLALRARTDLKLQAAQEGAAVVVHGTLTDVRRKPVPGAAVAVALVADRRVDEVARTDAEGRFRVEVPIDSLTAAARLIHAETRFAGSAQLGEASAELVLDLDKLDAVLELTVAAEGSEREADVGDPSRPTEVRTDAAAVAVQVLARAGDLPLAGASVQVAVDGKAWLVLRTNVDGAASAVLPVSALGAPGPHALTVHLAADPQHNAADAGERLLLLAAVQVDLKLRPGADGEPCAVGDWCVEGNVHALRSEVAGTTPERRPVRDAAVSLHADRRQLGTLVTDADGRFAAVLRGASLQKLFAPGPIGVVARAHVPAPHHDLGLSAIAVLDLPPPAGLSGWYYGGPMLALALAALVGRLRARQRERALLAQTEATSAGLPSQAMRPGEPGAPSCVVRGQVLHGESGRPVGARLTLLATAGADTVPVQEIDSEDGQFGFDPAPPGRYLLRVACPEHEPLQVAVDLPHDGAFEGCALLPPSCRAVVRGSFAASVRRFTGRAVDWAVETPREVEPRWATSVRRGHGEVRDAVRKVERALYGARTHPDDVAVARQALAKVDEVQK